ncbi:Deuterolysin metalloprotease family-domain-containing protein [Apodospora peruviana]|uniref:Neutral protease 2 n=1 Tax=Apodospora peruviana TaxID=516989 RepID=A0AAE0HWF1_9PEZI|nr:Deuterolysin metalloprotease family-domain-containing protein [Apodospora peruviana]
MKFLSVLAIFGSMAAAVSIDLNQRATPLSVNIEVVDNSNVKATITNTGKTALKVLKPGSILDSTAVEKSVVFSDAGKIAFDGIRLRVATSNLAEEAFQVIQAGETISTSWDVAEVHDLSAGGAFDISAVGALSYAEADSNSITGSVPYTSNIVTASVDGAAAAKIRRAFRESIEKRTIVQSDCTGTRLTATRNAISNCRALAAAASSAAVSGSAAKMTEYFKSSSSSTRSTVAAVFGRVATECGSTTSGVSRQYCTDVYPACSSGVLAYTLPSQSYMVNCPLYFSNLPALTSTCHAQDQATTTLHEVTHLSQIKGTTDQSGCYGYSCVQSLTAAQNLNHADTYSLFANAIKVGC